MQNSYRTSFSIDKSEFIMTCHKIATFRLSSRTCQVIPKYVLKMNFKVVRARSDMYQKLYLCTDTNLSTKATVIMSQSRDTADLLRLILSRTTTKATKSLTNSSRQSNCLFLKSQISGSSRKPICRTSRVHHVRNIYITVAFYCVISALLTTSTCW